VNSGGRKEQSGRFSRGGGRADIREERGTSEPDRGEGEFAITHLRRDDLVEDVIHRFGGNLGCGLWVQMF
jgi:hypothetical protein